METIFFDSKANLITKCKDICRDKQLFYKDEIERIEQYGVTVTSELLFRYNGKYFKQPKFDKHCAVVLCSYIYPSDSNIKIAEKANTCKCYCSKIGTIKRIRDSTYRLRIDTRVQRRRTLFFKHYLATLSKGNIRSVLRRYSFGDIILNVRKGNCFNSSNGLLVKTILVIFLLVLLFLIRLAVPTGYHPSLK